MINDLPVSRFPGTRVSPKHFDESSNAHPKRADTPAQSNRYPADGGFPKRSSVRLSVIDTFSYFTKAPKALCLSFRDQIRQTCENGQNICPPTVFGPFFFMKMEAKLFVIISKLSTDSISYLINNLSTIPTFYSSNCCLNRVKVRPGLTYPRKLPQESRGALRPFHEYSMGGSISTI
ncbi:hypothetical protein OPQ81_008645 [Rhizoctonia solani]|nr:hypothetical protein OPQ81_008645 [Rhizoctonia solani]